MESIKKVGVLVMTRISNLLVGVSQSRGTFHYRKLKPLSYPGISQVTVFGKVNPGETDIHALMREAREEIGTKAAKAVFLLQPNRQRRCLVNYVGSDETVVIYGDYTSNPDFLSCITLEGFSGGIRLINQGELDSVKIITPMERIDGMLYRPRSEIGMTPDVLMAFREAFKFYGP